ncbi:hypothetical protein [Paenibacillus mendelii]|uniref:Lipoprotein n=1 Tax=Paenibacillus mendelii TaxID=206163 RepID=A0ABV6JEV8_9BACL|nr:hypothetical protein [Paenibacillus mendelii]MCQ6557316.1 hypothetical protein [Paenibacillus mendelii]
MRETILLGFAILTLLLTACASPEQMDNENPSTINYEVLNKTNAEVTEDEFIYRLVTKKGEYRKGESVTIYAELEYVGDSETITIFHAQSPFSFPIEEKTRNYSIDYNMNQPLLSTTLKKGEPLREVYQNSGSYGETDDKEYINFMKSFWKDGFPVGYFVVDGFADFYVVSNVDGEEKEEEFNIKAQIDFKVVT